MPIYNTEKYLEKAINSVLSQTFSDFELILVDDCSPDNCDKICDTYLKKDGRISVLHLEQNGGLSNARNQGITLISGQYVMFMDSDDTIEPGLFSSVWKSLCRNPAKAVIFGLEEDYYNRVGAIQFSRKIFPDEKFITNQDELRKLIIQLEEQTLYGYSCNKFYDTSYLHSLGLKFEKIALIEDIQFNVKFFMDADSVNLIHKADYHYNRRQENSLTSKFVTDYFPLHHMRVQLIFDQYAYWNMLTDYVKSQLANIFIRYIFSALQRNCDERAHLTHLQRKTWLTDLFDDSLYRELVPFAKPQSHMMQLLYLFLKRKQIFPCLLSAQVISLVKNKMPIIFSKLKQNR